MKRPGFRSPSAAAAFSAGFTLIELVVVLAIVAIMAALAMPSLRSLIESNRVAAEANDFVGDLQFARSEAIKQGLPVSLCASEDGSSCSGNNTWGKGWIVFSDPDGSGDRGSDDTEALLRARPAWKNADTFSATPSAAAVTYTRDGFANMPAGADTGIVLTLRTAIENAAATRCVSLNRVGHQTVQTGGTGTCS